MHRSTPGGGLHGADARRGGVPSRRDRPGHADRRAGAMSATPYRSEVPLGRDGFPELAAGRVDEVQDRPRLGARRGYRRTPDRAVRLPGHLSPPEREHLPRDNAGIDAVPVLSNAGPSKGADRPRRRGGDRYLLLRTPTLRGDGTITVRIGSLTGRAQTGNGNGVSRRRSGRGGRSGAAVGEGGFDPHPCNQARLRVRRGRGHRGPWGADAVRLRPRHRGSARARGLPALAAPDPLGHHGDGLRVH